MDTTWRTHDLSVPSDAQPAELIGREWLLSNGTGSYAMGTAAGVNTRRYHGLLIAATRPPVGRVMVLNQMYEQLTIGGAGARKGETIEFTSCQFLNDKGQEIFAPSGHTLLERFERGLTVRWTYANGDVKFVRELILDWQRAAATLRYEVHGLTKAKKGSLHLLRLGPMLTLRDFHAVHKQGQTAPTQIDAGEDEFTARHDGTAATIRCAGSQFVSTEPEQARWWSNAYYAVEHERGMEDREDYYAPGVFEVELAGGDKPAVVEVTVELEGDESTSGGEGRDGHLDTILKAVQRSAVEEDTVARAITVAADDFVVGRSLKGESLSTILAGYPWFSDWGRDTFIALPGLLLVTGRHEEARRTLRLYAEAIKDGFVPNRFDDYDETWAHYNTVDASLWYVNAALEYLRVSGDQESWQDWLSEAVRSIVDAYIRGTSYDTRMSGDALISAGSNTTQLTWMDAACGGTVFTPRPGKTVEVNALWYNALTGVAEALAESDPSTAQHYNKLAKRITRSFTKTFWQAERNYLCDHVWVDDEGNEHRDETIRPNQVFAVCLPRSPLARTRKKQVIKAVRDLLLTPYGLQTLTEEDPAYHPRYTGTMFQRDEAYHQGTIWPWLIGPYAEGVLRAGDFSEASRRQAREAIRPLIEFMMGRGLGQLHEIHEAQPPHRPVGCTAQAWSVAEVLRVMHLLREHESK